MLVLPLAVAEGLLVEISEKMEWLESQSKGATDAMKALQNARQMQARRRRGIDGHVRQHGYKQAACPMQRAIRRRPL